MKKVAILLSTLTIIFLILKVIGIIDWSLLWVFAPLWIPIASLMVIVVLAVIMSVVDDK